jgi:hypothetical protein
VSHLLAKSDRVLSRLSLRLCFLVPSIVPDAPFLRHVGLIFEGDHGDDLFFGWLRRAQPMTMDEDRELWVSIEQ